MAGQNGETGEPRSRRGRGTRYAVAGIVAVAIGGVGLTSYYQDGLRICREAVVADRVERLCNPWTLEDFAPLAPLVALLLFYDLSELSIGGITLKRQLQTQKEELKLQGLRQDAIEARLTAVQQVRTEQVVHVYPQDVRDLPSAVSDKARTLQVASEDLADYHAAPVPGAPAEPAAGAQEPADPAALAVEPPSLTRASGPESDVTDLLRLWSTLASYVDSTPPHLSPEAQGALERWRTLFEEEITSLRGVRNTLTEDPDRLAPAAMGAAVDAARMLLNLLYGLITDPQLEPRWYEEMIAFTLRNALSSSELVRSWRLERPRRGVDFLAEIDGQHIAVEAKSQHSDTARVPAAVVQRFIEDVRAAGAHAGVLVTNRELSQGARDALANAPVPLRHVMLRYPVDEPGLRAALEGVLQRIPGR